jgi:hypothetical protein
VIRFGTKKQDGTHLAFWGPTDLASYEELAEMAWSGMRPSSIPKAVRHSPAKIKRRSIISVETGAFCFLLRAIIASPRYCRNDRLRQTISQRKFHFHRAEQKRNNNYAPCNQTIEGLHSEESRSGPLSCCERNTGSLP